MDDFPAKVEDRADNDHGVILEERGNIGHGPEGTVADEGEHHTLEDKADPAAIGLEAAIVRERPTVDALSLASVVESEVGDGHDDKIDHSTSSDESDQPSEDHLRTARDREEGEEGETDDHAEAEDWDAALRALAQESRCAAFEGHAIEGAGRTVGICIAIAKD